MSTVHFPHYLLFSTSALGLRLVLISFAWTNARIPLRLLRWVAKAAELGPKPSVQSAAKKSLRKHPRRPQKHGGRSGDLHDKISKHTSEETWPRERQRTGTL